MDCYLTQSAIVLLLLLLSSITLGFHLPSTPSRRLLLFPLKASPHDVQDTVFDLAVIGGGPVGVSAALQAARSPFGKKVVLIDAPRASGALMNEATGEDLR